MLQGKYELIVIRYPGIAVVITVHAAVDGSHEEEKKTDWHQWRSNSAFRTAAMSSAVRLLMLDVRSVILFLFCAVGFITAVGYHNLGQSKSILGPKATVGL